MYMYIYNGYSTAAFVAATNIINMTIFKVLREHFHH